MGRRAQARAASECVVYCRLRRWVGGMGTGLYALMDAARLTGASVTGSSEPRNSIAKPVWRLGHMPMFSGFLLRRGETATAPI